jgi:hypothetical protein
VAIEGKRCAVSQGHFTNTRSGCTFYIISANFTAGEMKNLASIPFFILLLTLLSGIIQIDGALTGSKAVAKKSGLS